MICSECRFETYRHSEPDGSASLRRGEVRLHLVYGEEAARLLCLGCVADLRRKGRVVERYIHGVGVLRASRLTGWRATG